ncbi:16S rRNA (cytidine(1402)-2'-O)-methyltransferase [Caproicibacterium amylolyticum]|uniref:Ribosomal RNA small subunit methyltransferase I n=1 Tax=Caproicibacterium amylolyticum TaxID=2766537 RepID=A0A7G9WHG5_9FIRM|nr:16S rRNA (cytidine(1402)-2'-O)-methyltransferase [Caproicibacterium amylolyticum]QNO18127.1 16S rRNA (cytidine(1402)-2'-O)-methyltransferase [Caproicibacterium amylolyticum]
MSGTLYIIGTPIGNLGDLSPRAVKILSSVDFIAAEDTRVTLKLLTHFGIKKPLISYFEHNKMERGEIILARVEAGENCAQVSDAGMPAISDPGELLVRQAHERGIPVVAVPGPSAVITALAVSGLPTGRFTFEGFLSVNKKSRREHLAEVKNEHRTMVFYEAPHKLLTTLTDMLAAWGDRPLALVRELTKIHEEVRRTTLSEAVAYYTENPPRGEFVLVIAGAPQQAEQQAETLEDAVKLAQSLIDGGAAASAAAKEAASVTGYKKNEIYRLLQQKPVQ